MTVSVLFLLFKSQKILVTKLKKGFDKADYKAQIFDVS